MKIFFRYLIFIGIPYLIARRIKKYYWKHTSPEIRKKFNKKLKGSKRQQFILFVIATILFSVGRNFTLFAWFMDRLRMLIGTGDDADTIREHVIECYREFNAPTSTRISGSFI
mgnify:CR=1 FL=1